jgi:hypothetical protein
MCIVPPQPASTTATVSARPRCTAQQLNPRQRIRLALDALTGHRVGELAQRHHVSRKFVSRQRRLALDALDSAFNPPPPPAERVLFHLPVTRSWLEQLALALVLICHCSLRGVHELLRDLFDYHRSVGSIHNLTQRAIATAAAVNAGQDLGGVLKAALDEIFQGGRPILSVVDVASTYCCLLSLEDQRDADTWAVRLLELQEQGFAPLALIGDAAKGLQAGVTEAGLGPCRADVWHPERDLGELVRFLENRAYAAIGAFDKLDRQLRGKRRHTEDEALRQKRDAACGEMARAVALADDVAVLASWLGQDVLGVAGPPFQQRQELFDFVLGQLKAREPCCEHRIRPVCSSLEKQKAALLAFAQEMDQDISSLASYAQVSEEVVREVVAVQEMPVQSAARWRRDAELHRQLRGRYHGLSEMVEELRKGVVRASSVVENVNSRVRNYFFLRKEVGQGYLELLRFFLNHRRFLRSEHPQREGKSPAELLNGQGHEHWLEMLGYQRFRRAG